MPRATGNWKIETDWASGEIYWYEKAVGRSTTGDLVKIGTSEVAIGNTGQDVDLKIYIGESGNTYMQTDAGNGKVYFYKTTTSTSPGRFLYIQALGSLMASGQNLQGMQIRSRATGTGTIAGGTDGAEIKAGLNSNSDTGTIAGARAIIANIDAKKGTITTGTCLEAQVDLGAGGEITTLYGVRAALNNSGTVTNGYAYHVDAVAGYPWTYGLYIKSQMATTGIYIGTSTTGITFAGTLTTGISFGSATVTTDITKAGDMTISTTGTTKNLTLSTTGDIALNPAGADITIGGVSGSAGKLTAHATKLTVYGGDTTGDDLVLMANSADNEAITLNGAGAIAFTNANNVTFSGPVVEGESGDTTCVALSNTSRNGMVVYSGTPTSGGTDFTTGNPISGIRSRLLVGTAQTNDTSWYGVFGQLRIKANRSQGIGAAVRGYVEESGDTTMAAGQTSALLASVEVSSGFSLSAGNLEGLRVESLADASATMTGAFNGIYVAKGSGKLEFDYGIYIDDAATRSIYSNTTPAGSSAVNAWECTVTDACTTSSGYAHGIHVSANNTGVKTGGCSATQFNPIGVDLTLTAAGSGASGAGFYALYAYIMKSGSPDCSHCSVAGVNVELTELGAIDYYAGLWVNKYNTTLASGPDAFCLFSNQATGVTRAGFYFQGDKPSYLIQCANNATDNMQVVSSGTYSTADGYFKIYLASTEYRIPFYAGVD